MANTVLVKKRFAPCVEGDVPGHTATKLRPSPSPGQSYTRSYAIYHAA